MTADFKDEAVLTWLQQWYSNQSNGEWEHVYGIEISTLDNPGWHIKVDLKDTGLERLSFEKVKIERTENDWVHCSIDDDVFKGACGPGNLTELLNHFRSFADKVKE
jgi:Immunity protein 53